MPKVRSIIKWGRPQAGFSVVEVLLAATVLGVLATGIIGALVYGREATADAGNSGRANLIAEEGIEAVRNIGAASYANLVDGTYGLSSSGGTWAFSGTSDVTDIFTRVIVISTPGTNRKLITSTVTWSGMSGGSVVHTARITNWAATFKSWGSASSIIAGTTQPSGTTANLKVATYGNYAYVVRNAASTNFAVINNTNPAAPTVSTNASVTGTPTNVMVSGSFLYVTTGTASSCLLIYSLATPTSPSLVKTVSMTGTGACKGVFVSGGYAYVVRAADATAGANEFNVVNVQTPASATVVGGYNNDIQMNEVWAYGPQAYVATSSTTQEMLVINLNVPTAPALAATYNPATTLAATTIWGFGNTVLLGMTTTLDAINVTVPTTPTRLTTFTAGGNINDIDVDITNKTAFLGTSNTAGELQAVTLSGLPGSMISAKIQDVTGTTSAMNGVCYNSALDIVLGASSSTTQGVFVFNRN
ncbi:MAG TPA: hypothetical protein VLI54_00635 [Bacillota bacterium]|nr:hypothetical protein [Bacillota bacterium]